MWVCGSGQGFSKHQKKMLTYTMAKMEGQISKGNQTTILDKYNRKFQKQATQEEELKD